MNNILQEILRHKHQEFPEERVIESELQQLCELQRENHRPFCLALNRAIGRAGSAVIAELKKASPSAGLICDDFRPAELATALEQEGAACLSVLTDEQWFQGDVEHLLEARAACALPVLRKDFIVSNYQVCQTAALGADCLLLIVAAFPDDFSRLTSLADQAQELGLEVLVEVHTPQEMELVLRSLEHFDLIGINNRNLDTFEVDLATTVELSKMVPEGIPLVCESGIRSAGDVRMILASGVSRFLIGETLMRQSAAGLSQLFG